MIYLVYLLKLSIFHSCVKLPEGLSHLVSHYSCCYTSWYPKCSWFSTPPIYHSLIFSTSNPLIIPLCLFLHPSHPSDIPFISHEVWWYPMFVAFSSLCMGYPNRARHRSRRGVRLLPWRRCSTWEPLEFRWTWDGRLGSTVQPWFFPV